MDTPFVAVLTLLVGVAGLVGCYAFSVMFAHEAAERLVAPRALVRSRGTGPASSGSTSPGSASGPRGGPEVMAAVDVAELAEITGFAAEGREVAARQEAPEAAPVAERLASRAQALLLPGATAALAGVGTALLTVALRLGSPWYGLVPVVCAVAGAGWSAVALIRRGRDGGRWLSRTRSLLAGYLDPGYRPAGPTERAWALARVLRVERTGIRMTGRADRAGLRDRLASPTPAELLTGVLWLFSSAVMGMISLVMFMGVTMPSVADLATMAVLGLSFLTGPAALLLHRENRRRRLHRIGTELTADARRAAAVLAVRHG